MSRYLSKSVFRQALKTRTRPALVAAYPLQSFDTFKRLNSNSSKPSAPKNPYTALGLPLKASMDDVRKKSFLLAKKYHPDVNKSPDANLKFIESRSAKEAIEEFDTTVSERDKAAWDQKWSRQFTRPAFTAAERAAEEILRVERDRKRAEREEEFQRIRADREKELERIRADREKELERKRAERQRELNKTPAEREADRIESELQAKREAERREADRIQRKEHEAERLAEKRLRQEREAEKEKRRKREAQEKEQERVTALLEAEERKRLLKAQRERIAAEKEKKRQWEAERPAREKAALIEAEKRREIEEWIRVGWRFGFGAVAVGGGILYTNRDILSDEEEEEDEGEEYV